MSMCRRSSRMLQLESGFHSFLHLAGEELRFREMKLSYWRLLSLGGANMGLYVICRALFFLLFFFSAVWECLELQYQNTFFHRGQNCSLGHYGWKRWCWVNVTETQNLKELWTGGDSVSLLFLYSSPGNLVLTLGPPWGAFKLSPSSGSTDSPPFHCHWVLFYTDYSLS